MGLDPVTMDVVMCERHSGAQPGGGICAICLQERLVLLWRGEGNCNWDMEEFSVTPPPGACKTPTPEPSPVVVDEEDLEEDEDAATRPSGTCFPVLFRVRHLQRRDEDGSCSHSLQEGREKIDRSEHNQFSCELKSIVKELAALHEKKKKKLAKRRGPGSDTGCISGRRQPHEEVAADVTQAPVTDIGDTVNMDTHAVRKAKGSIVEDEEDARYTGKVMCFSTLWPAIVNMKWARVLVSPIMSSNKIAPSKSDLLSKLVNGLPKTAAAAAAVDAREDSGRNCETSGSNDLDRSTAGHQAHDDDDVVVVLPSQALLPPRYVQPAADEDGTVLEIDKETKLRMEASRITVMTWLQSLPSPKAVRLEHSNSNKKSNQNNNSHKGVIPDDLSLGNGVLEMCDEEEVEFDCQSQEADENAIADPVEFMTSFGKFLRTSSQIYAPTRMVDIEIAAQ